MGRACQDAPAIHPFSLSALPETDTDSTPGHCPNVFSHTADSNWDAATGSRPWYTNCTIPQAITDFQANPSPGTAGGTSTLSATGGGSGKPVSFASSTPAVRTVAGSTVSYVAAGTCSVTADQAGNASYCAAPRASLNITVSVAAVPTLSHWAMFVLAAPLGLFGLRRRT